MTLCARGSRYAPEAHYAKAKREQGALDYKECCTAHVFYFFMTPGASDRADQVVRGLGRGAGVPSQAADSLKLRESLGYQHRNDQGSRGGAARRDIGPVLGGRHLRSKISGECLQRIRRVSPGC